MQFLKWSSWLNTNSVKLNISWWKYFLYKLHPFLPLVPLPTSRLSFISGHRATQWKESEPWASRQKTRPCSRARRQPGFPRRTMPGASAALRRVMNAKWPPFTSQEPKPAGCWTPLLPAPASQWLFHPTITLRKAQKPLLLQALCDANRPNMLGSVGPHCSLLATSVESRGGRWQGQ